MYSPPLLCQTIAHAPDGFDIILAALLGKLLTEIAHMNLYRIVIVNFTVIVPDGIEDI